MKFHLGDVLSITTGILLSPDGMNGVYRILNHMTGDDLFTHQLPRAAEECRPTLREQHPALAGIEPPELDGEAAAMAWLAEQVTEYGEMFDVEPLSAGDHMRINPLAELSMMAPHMEIIPVVLGDES